jgi:carboxylate-amine ligase
LYNQIFDCSGHGWSNVQSTHINLPFYDDVEFEKLHAAIRIVLPLIPALFASSPIIEGVVSADKDARLNFYKSNQKEIPEMAGFIIPEQVFTKDDYHERIFSPINAAIKPFDKNGVLDHHFLNSRGAIARFDRNAIEIRLADIQECPQADIGLCAFLIAVLKKLVNGDFATLSAQKSWHESDLLPLLEGGIQNAEEYLISNLEYLQLFGVNEPISMGLLWKRLFVLSKDEIQNEHHAAILNVLENGTLSTRILNELKQDLNTDNIIEVYKKLADCLMHNTLF